MLLIQSPCRPNERPCDWFQLNLRKEVSLAPGQHSIGTEADVWAPQPLFTELCGRNDPLPSQKRKCHDRSA